MFVEIRRPVTEQDDGLIHHGKQIVIFCKKIVNTMDQQGMTIQEIASQRLLGALEAAEEMLDNQLQAMDKYEEDDYERIRRKRLDALKKSQEMRAKYLAAGHGKYNEAEDQKRFFEELKGSPRAVVHFYRSSTRRCEIVDKHLSILARNHIETKFMRVNAEKFPFVCERLKIWMLPTIVLIKDGKTDHSIIGFDELGGNDNFSTEQLQALLLKYGVVHEQS